MNQPEPAFVQSVLAWIVERRRALDTLETALRAVYAAPEPMAPVVEAPTKRRPGRPKLVKTRTPSGRRARVQSGTVPDRILAVLKEAGAPVGRKVLIAGAKVDGSALKNALKDLENDGRIKVTGIRAGTKYAIAA